MRRKREGQVRDLERVRVRPQDELNLRGPLNLDHRPSQESRCRTRPQVVGLADSVLDPGSSEQVDSEEVPLHHRAYKEDG